MGKARIMIVEDEAIMALHIQEMLEDLNYEVPAVASEGEEAVQKAVAVRPDLVLMDINLGGMIDGVMAAEQVRARLDIPVIYLTAYSDESTMQRAKITEPSGYVLKPLAERELHIAIEIALYRHRAEQALKQSEERYRAVVRQSADGIFLADVEDKRVLEVNPALQRLLGYTSEELLGLTLYDFVDHEPASIDGHIQRLQTQRDHSIGEQRYRRRDGSLVAVEVSANLVVYADREVMCAVARDITARKRAEEARKRAVEELEAQRVLSARSDRLRSLGEMAAGMAHELNQPLVGVRGAAEHLLLGLERGWDLVAEKFRDRLELIVEQADRMVHIIEHIRRFAREAGRPESTSVQVNQVVQSALGMLGEQFHARGLELECDLAEDLALVRANSFSLEEVLLNLLSNARDALEERGEVEDGEPPLRVDLRTLMADQEGMPQVRIEVSDTGVGISPDIQEKMFEPFFTTKGPDQGTGLGLAISKSIIEEAGGRIQVQSAPGEGTTVTISLPAEI